MNYSIPNLKVPILLLGTRRCWRLEFRRKWSFLAGAGIKPLPFGSKECYALLTGAITARLYRSFRENKYEFIDFCFGCAALG